MYLTKETVRKHLNLDEFFTDDDSYLLDLIKVAEDATEKRIGKPLSKCIDKKTGDLIPSIKHTILLLIGTLYSQRESTSPSTITKVPYTFDFLSSLNQEYRF